MSNQPETIDWIYRAMREENGSPKLGNSAIKLGVRKYHDIEVDALDMVHCSLFREHEPNGLSCSPAITDLPFFARPRKCGGYNSKTEVWAIKAGDLGADLIAGKDGAKHISIGPSRTMLYDEYARAIENMLSKWVKTEATNGT